MSSDADRIKVVCRIRPPLSHTNRAVHAEDDTTVKIHAGVGRHQQKTDDPVDLHASNTPTHSNVPTHLFTFDRVFEETCTQTEVYENAGKHVVESVMHGYNGCIFAYGQTGSGKTYTMSGPPLETVSDVAASRGIIPRMVDTVFETIQNSESHIEFIVKCSYVEIYMERIRDLLRTDQSVAAASSQSLRVREEAHSGRLWIEGATECYVSSAEDVLAVMQTGDQVRASASTRMNARSSRSHAIFILEVTQSSMLDQSKKCGKLYLVDLAGSEKVSRSGATGITFDEAKTINTSLSALGNVINALTEEKATHIPYRDSKLTRVLQECLGGNSRTTLIVHCSPCAEDGSESLSTLRFGNRAKQIKNHAIINEERSALQLQALLKAAEAENQRLRSHCDALEEALHSKVSKANKAGGVDGDHRASDSGGTAGVTDSAYEMQAATASLILSLRRQLTDTESQHKRLCADHEHVLRRLEVAMDELDELQSAQQDANAQESALHDEIARLTASERALRDENEVLLERLADASMEAEAQRRSIEAAKADADAARADAEAQRAALEVERSGASRATSAQSTPSHREAAHADATAASGAASARADDDAAPATPTTPSFGAPERTQLEERLEHIEAELSASQPDSAAELDDARRALEEERDQFRKFKRATRSTLADIGKLKDVLLADLESRCARITELEAVLAESRRQYDALVAATRAEAAQRQASAPDAALRAELHTVSNARARLQMENDVMRKQLALRTDRIKNLEALLIEAQTAAFRRLTVSNALTPPRIAGALTGTLRVARPIRGGTAALPSTITSSPNGSPVGSFVDDSAASAAAKAIGSVRTSPSVENTHANLRALNTLGRRQSASSSTASSPTIWSLMQENANK